MWAKCCRIIVAKSPLVRGAGSGDGPYFWDLLVLRRWDGVAKGSRQRAKAAVQTTHNCNSIRLSHLQQFVVGQRFVCIANAHLPPDKLLLHLSHCIIRSSKCNCSSSSSSNIRPTCNLRRCTIDAIIWFASASGGYRWQFGPKRWQSPAAEAIKLASASRPIILGVTKADSMQPRVAGNQKIAAAKMPIPKHGQKNVQFVRLGLWWRSMEEKCHMVIFQVDQRKN